MVRYETGCNSAHCPKTRHEMMLHRTASIFVWQVLHVVYYVTSIRRRKDRYKKWFEQ